MLICFLILIILVLLCLVYRHWPPEMSEIGLKHFHSGLLFLAFSAVFLVLNAIIWNISPKDAFAHRPILFWLAFGGGTTNAIGLFQLLRELRNLFPGGSAGDITPEGMLFGFIAFLGQAFWSIYGFGLMFAP